MADEKLILERTIELLVMSGCVTRFQVEAARRLAISLIDDAAEPIVAPDAASTVSKLCPACHQFHPESWCPNE